MNITSITWPEGVSALLKGRFSTFTATKLLVLFRERALIHNDWDKKHSFWSLRYTVNTITTMPKTVNVYTGQGDNERDFEQL
jgi:hypothetical protein